MSFPSDGFRANNRHGKPERPVGIKGLVRWAITPPQSYAIYLVGLFLVAGLSFYVGTLKPKKAVSVGPPPISAPRN